MASSAKIAPRSLKRAETPKSEPLVPIPIKKPRQQPPPPPPKKKEEEEEKEEESSSNSNREDESDSSEEEKEEDRVSTWHVEKRTQRENPEEVLVILWEACGEPDDFRAYVVPVTEVSDEEIETLRDLNWEYPSEMELHGADSAAWRRLDKKMFGSLKDLKKEPQWKKYLVRRDLSRVSQTEFLKHNQVCVEMIRLGSMA